jgi:hypothetical protein
MKNENHPKDPMTGANGRLNNKQITLKKIRRVRHKKNRKNV